MKPREIFEICHETYRRLAAARAMQTGKIAHIVLEIPSAGYQWRPESALGGRADEYIADFEKVGERALRRPEWAGRRKLFRIYFLRCAEYKRAIHLVGVSESTFDYWVQEVKKTVGRELLHAGLFPPGKYFRCRE